MRQEQILGLLSGSLRDCLRKAAASFSEIYELRLRAGRPFLLMIAGKEWFVSRDGHLTDRVERAYIVSEAEIRETLEYVAGYSLYAFEEELRQGFLTVQGGHRVGVAGSVVTEAGQVRTISAVTSLNIRLAHEKKGCADGILPWIRSGSSIYHTLILSPPRCGKTTLLRDIIRQLSDGDREYPGCTVGVVDERSEIAGCYHGVPQNDVGLRTDVLDACPKGVGMMMLIRAMAPQVVAVDELGSLLDLSAIESVVHCGCRLLATMHGDSLEEVRKKPLMARLLEEQIFERYLVLAAGSPAGRIQGIYNGEGERIKEGSSGSICCNG